MDLFRKALSNDLDKAQRMIEEDYDIINSHSDEMTPLIFAIYQGNLPVVQFLLEQGADANIPDLKGFSPVYFAIVAKETEEGCDILKLLLKNGADLTASGEKGAPLPSALMCASLKYIKLLLDYGADFGAVGDNSAVYYAARNPNVDVIEFILENQGLHIDHVDSCNRTALHHAAAANNFRVCEFLLQSGAIVNRRCIDGETPLTLAFRKYFVCYKDLEAVVRLLLEYGADATAKAGGISALQIAVNQYWHGRWDHVAQGDILSELLIPHMAKLVHLNLNINECDRKFIKDNQLYSTCYEESMQELEDMKNTNFYNNVSVQDVFLGSAKMTYRHAKDEDLVKALETAAHQGAYEMRFPIYFNDLKKKFYGEVERQRFRRAAAETLCKLFKFNHPLHIVNQKILGHMSDKDLKFLDTRKKKTKTGPTCWNCTALFRKHIWLIFIMCSLIIVIDCVNTFLAFLGLHRLFHY